MKFRARIEIGEMTRMSPPFLPKLQVGQHVAVDGTPGRYVGISRAGIVWILYGKETKLRSVKIMNTAFKRVNGHKTVQ